MNQEAETLSTHPETASTEGKAGARRRSRKATASESVPTPPPATGSTPAVETIPAYQSTRKGTHVMNNTPSILNSSTRAKFVLFTIPRTEIVANGPVMRGFLEIKAEEGGTPIKVNVAAWRKIGRTSGTEYLSLKVGNNSPEDPEAYSVGPFYGRLFRQVEGNRTRRYFGFIEESEKTDEDENGQGTYATHWQIRVNAKPSVSNDGKTRYIGGTVVPSQQHEESIEEAELPF